MKDKKRERNHRIRNRLDMKIIPGTISLALIRLSSPPRRISIRHHRPAIGDEKTEPEAILHIIESH